MRRTAFGKFGRGVAMFFLVSGVLSVTHAAPPPVPGEKSVLTVTAVQPLSESWAKTLTVSGGIYPWQEAIVSAELGGLAIISLPVDVGSVVKRGQELAKLSDGTIRATLAQQRANVARAKANLAMAQANATRARAVKGSGALSEQQVTQYLLGEESSRAELAAAQALLELEGVRLRQTRIVAVDEGVISARNATLGAVVQAGSELFRLVRQGRLEWRAELTANQLALIKSAQQAQLACSNGQTTTATMRQIAPTLDPVTRKGVVYFDVPRQAPLKAGMFAQGEIHLGQAPAMTVPKTSIVHNDGYTTLFEVTADARAVRHKVVLGRLQGSRVEIISGVDDKIKVVATGGAFLKDGDRVQVTEQTP